MEMEMLMVLAQVLTIAAVAMDLVDAQLPQRVQLHRHLVLGPRLTVTVTLAWDLTVPLATLHRPLLRTMIQLAGP